MAACYMPGLPFTNLRYGHVRPKMLVFLKGFTMPFKVRQNKACFKPVLSISLSVTKEQS